MIKNRATAWLAAAVLTMFLTETRGSAADFAQGRELFSRCAACHLADGAGVPGAFPALTCRLGRVVNTPQARQYLVLVIQRGLNGEIQIGDSRYRGVMPAQGPGLGDISLVAVLNYVLGELNRQSLPANWRAFTAAEVGQISRDSPDLAGPDLLALRGKAFRANSKCRNH